MKTEEPSREELLRQLSDLRRQLVHAEARLTEFKRYEAELKEAVHTKDILVREVHHRVKNNLQVMSSLLRLQARYVKDESTLHTLNDSQNRIQSMAIVHELLYESPDLQRVDRREYLSRIARYVYHSHGISPDRISLEIEVEPVGCSIEMAIPLGLIVNELVSNCLKHAFPQDRKGRIKICTRGMAEHGFELIVEDNGQGIPEDTDLTSVARFGLYLVNTLAEQLHGKVELHRRDGLQVHVRGKDSVY